MNIKFKNWAKFQPGRVPKNPYWLALSNRIFYDAKMCELDGDEFITMIYLLCEASLANKDGEVFISPEHHRIHNRKTHRNPDQVLHRTLEKLLQLQIIEQPRVHGMYAVTAKICSTRQDKTRQHKHNTLPEPTVPEFDFEKVYKKYPRKEGKTPGFKLCRKQIKTQSDFEALQTAVARYTSHVRRSNTEQKYIKLFSTFMGEWRDWTEPDTGGAVVEESSPEAIRIEKLAQEAERNARLSGN